MASSHSKTIQTWQEYRTAIYSHEEQTLALEARRKAQQAKAELIQEECAKLNEMLDEIRLKKAIAMTELSENSSRINSVNACVLVRSWCEHRTKPGLGTCSRSDLSDRSYIRLRYREETRPPVE